MQFKDDIHAQFQSAPDEFLLLFKSMECFSPFVQASQKLDEESLQEANHEVSHAIVDAVKAKIGHVNYPVNPHNRKDTLIHSEAVSCGFSVLVASSE
jgi:hypothetical protein